MPRTSQMIPSNYLKQSDFEQESIVTIKELLQKNIAMEGKPAENKWLIFFEEFDKPMVLNNTNIHALEKACGSDDTDDWIGHEIIVYVDENVSFGGELVGGLRIKKYKPPAAPIVPKRRSQRVEERRANDSSDFQAFAEEDIPD